MVETRPVWDNRVGMNKTFVSLVSIVSVVAGCGPQGTNGREPRVAAGESPPGPPPSPNPDPAQSPDPAQAPSTTFVRFLLVGDEAGCPAQAHGDCHSSAELLANRTLRFDAWGEPGAAVREAPVPEGAFSTVVQRLTTPGVVRLLSADRPCRDANATESMTLRVGATEHAATTGACNEEPIMAARSAMIDLCSQLFPEHSLVSPPF